MEWMGRAMPDLVAEKVLEGWGVPQSAWDGLLEGGGADQVREIHDALRIILPIGTANGWMMRSSNESMFGGQAPMQTLLESGGLVAIHRLIVGRLDAMGRTLL